MVGGEKGGASLSTDVNTVIPTHGWEAKKVRCGSCLGKGTITILQRQQARKHVAAT